MLFATLPGDVRLCLLEDRHAEELFAVTDANREYLRQWLPWVDKTHSAEDTRAFIRKSLAQLSDNRGFNLGIWCGDRFAGAIGYHPIDWEHRHVEIGYWIAEEYQGRGIVTAACRLLLRHAFEVWKLERVQIRCAAGNARSCAVLARLGLTHEGVLRHAECVNGQYYDLNVFSILASEWDPARC